MNAVLDLTGLSATQIMERFTTVPAEVSTRSLPGRLTSAFETSNGPLQQQRDLLENAIARRLQHLVQETLMEPETPCIRELRTHYEKDFDTVLPVVVAWREISNQQDALEPWGNIPSASDKIMRNYYNNVQASLPSTDQLRQIHEDSSMLEAEDEWQQRQCLSNETLFKVAQSHALGADPLINQYDESIDMEYIDMEYIDWSTVTPFPIDDARRGPY